MFQGVGHTSRGRPARFKRQADRNQILNDIFQIPIQTLTAVQTLLQHTRPVFPNLYTAPPQPASASASAPAGGGGFFGQAPGAGAGYYGGTRPRPPAPAPAAAPASRPPPPASFLDDFFGRPRPSRGPLTFGANAVQVRPASDGSSFKI
ncbi:hypothetical protein R5R35_014224 [Gryllus longicercus]|uniref:Uncharacterized protein n=1 Tax=Gryllus longicercus TaxID=2509291 RepID=A0AAN9W317_9ORTH